LPYTTLSFESTSSGKQGEVGIFSRRVRKRERERDRERERERGGGAMGTG
jgi:hypothetical protein